MHAANSAPLVSLLLFSFGHEKYIEAAVKAALCQTYSNLEIIISDDCSSDGTFSIIENVVRSNDLGQHVVRIRKNDYNIGLARHFNSVMKIAKGEFIVTAGGDDISLPNRVELLVDRWLSSSKETCSIFTNATIIDSSGESRGPFYNTCAAAKTLDDFLSGKNCFVGGFSHGFSRSLYDDFGPIYERTIQEDGIIAFRALLAGCVHYIDQITVLYRIHETNSYSGYSPGRWRRVSRSMFYLQLGRITDLNFARNTLRKERKRVGALYLRLIFDTLVALSRM
jgi:glycosyltransferase involved in cell wall biosynthesis